MSATVFKQAVILAAGRGRRMGELTHQQPKCLNFLAGRPILAWTQDALRTNGIQEILIVTGWQHEKLFGWGSELKFNPQWANSNMVRSLQLAGESLARAPTLVLYGDGAYSAQAIGAALKGPAQDVVVPIDRLWQQLWHRRFSNPLDDAETLTFENSRLTGIGQRATKLSQIQGQFMGLLRITPRGWHKISTWLNWFEADRGVAAVDRLDMTGLLHHLISAGEPVYCSNVAGGWVEIDSTEDLYAVEQALDDPDFAHDFRD